jgi:peptidoglycan lytic transglycosylase
MNFEVQSNRAVRAAAALLPIVVVLFTGCASTPRAARTVGSQPTRPAPSKAIVGIASYYGKEYHGRTTASGEIFDMTKLTAAHRSLPFGINVRVTNLSNNQSVIVRVNDRGPFIAGRIIDLSLAAAQRLGMITAGLAKVSVEPIESGKVETRQTLSDAGAANGVPLTTGAHQQFADAAARGASTPVFSLAEVFVGQDIAGINDEIATQ